MKFSATVVAAVLLGTSSANGFSFTTSSGKDSLSTRGGPLVSDSALFLSPEDLTTAMAKAHEEKIRAMRDIEEKKNAEIKALKSEVETLKQNPEVSALAPAPVKNFSLDITNMSKEDLASQLVNYQQFMSKYIVDAQKEKMRAVQAAEAAITAKYEQKLKLYEGKPPQPSPPTAATPETKLYEGRNANIAAAAKAGKSRWGDMEVSKVQAESSLNGLKVNGDTAPATSESTPASITILSGENLYYHRNKMVAAAGAAGKSRWGEAEIKKATEEAAKFPSLASKPEVPAPATTSTPKIVVTPEIEAADHGLRNDGGVGGPSLAERVNLGQLLFANGAAAPAKTLAPAPNGSVSVSLYDSRNARVAAAAAAGKSRWGNMENDRAASLSSNALPSASSTTAAVAVATPPEVEAADHGLRADGGVGGPTLAQRVNLGADLLRP
mmetsp:Transcript_25980/g.42577  ORF Transcript_25980/g.42577 Transcript_25980/m.42577 type:complete len:439 (+) Transcript_25980:169-1485(+)